MNDTLHTVARRLLRRKVAGRNLKVRRQDVFLTSYPRSGNTWTRFLIAALIEPNAELNFDSVASLIPDIYERTNPQLWRLRDPRILKTHEPFDHRYPKIIYVVRDPRDVLLSYFKYHRDVLRRPETPSLDSFTDSFLDGKVDPFGSWGNHVHGWTSNRLGSPNFLLVRYEDLRREPLENTHRLADFLNLSSSERAVAEAVRRTGFNQMKSLATKSLEKGKARVGSEFVRRGAVRGWTAELPDELSSRVVGRFGHVMAGCGYEQ